MAKRALSCGRFRRVHDLAKRSGDSPAAAPRLGWVYVSHRALAPGAEDRRVRRRLRGALVAIRCAASGRTIHRRLAFRPNLKIPKAGEPGEIGLDWDSWIALTDGETGGEEDGAHTLEIRRSRALLAWMGVGHPDPTVHAAAVLGVVALALGVVSLGLAAVQLFAG